MEKSKNISQTDLHNAVESSCEDKPANKIARNIIAYVDGSFLNNSIGYGAVILQDGKEIKSFSGYIDNEEMLQYRQVAGEIEAVKVLVGWCKTEGINKLTICYDYGGIMKWPTRVWKAKNPLTQGYVEVMDNANLEINYRWVKAHQTIADENSFWNNRADELAKSGASACKGIAKKESTNETIVNNSLADLLEGLEKLGNNFAKYLSKKNIQARYDKIYNNMLARVIITVGVGKKVNFDIYNTKNRGIDSPYLSNADSLTKTLLLKEYKIFLNNINE